MLHQLYDLHLDILMMEDEDEGDGCDDDIDDSCDDDDDDDEHENEHADDDGDDDSDDDDVDDVDHDDGDADSMMNMTMMMLMNTVMMMMMMMMMMMIRTVSGSIPTARGAGGWCGPVSPHMGNAELTTWRLSSSVTGTLPSILRDTKNKIPSSLSSKITFSGTIFCSFLR